MTVFVTQGPLAWLCLFSNCINYVTSYQFDRDIISTSLMAVVSPTDRPKSDHNRCVIEVFGGVFVLSLNYFIF